jgi:hypothetical protein
MPLYFFQLHEDGELIHDAEGLILPDLVAAREQAIVGARSILSDAVRYGDLPLSFEIEVQDEAAAPLFKISFADAVTIR